MIATHPIQYIAPWFRSLAASTALNIEVIFFREPSAGEQGAGFGKAFQWDVPLREGYVSHVLGVPNLWSQQGKLLSRLRRQLAAIRPDAVLLTGWNEPGLMLASPLVRAMGIPIIMRGESNVLTRRSAAKKALHRALLWCSSAAVVIGSSNRDFYLQNGIPSQRLYPGAYFVESERMVQMAKAHAQERDALRRDAGFSDEDFVFLFVGKHVQFKRPALMIEAAALLRTRGYPVKLQFAGSGELTPHLVQRSEELRVHAHFTGFLNQTELWRAYVSADAFVLPSTNRETWGLVTNEAMLFGLPVIVSDLVGCAADLVVEGETGFAFTGGAEDLADSMLRLVRDPVRARAMGLNARRRVLDHYSMPAATHGLLQALHAVAS